MEIDRRVKNGLDHRNANAIDYIEEHITEKVDYEEIARCSCLSSYNFQRVFGILCGYTLGEYIRNRRLSLAGQDLVQTGMKVIDVAMKYGYESPDSFAKAFQKFHEVTPSVARESGEVLRSFSRLSVKISLEGGSVMNYKIEEKQEMILTGYKQRFSGVPYGEERATQEEKMFVTTRGKQWILRGAPCDYETLELEHIIIPKQLYVVVETDKMKRPINEYINLRREALGSNLRCLTPKALIVLVGAFVLNIAFHRNKDINQAHYPEHFSSLHNLYGKFRGNMCHNAMLVLILYHFSFSIRIYH